ncbi:MAG: zinc ribbon domain-containing protein [Candidatus Heimdallarchaeaceae archaeon]|jgi:hypothetical protein
MTASEKLDLSAVKLMKIAGFLFLAVAAINAALEIISEVLEFFALSIVSSILIGLAVVLLGLSARRLAQISPGVARSADSAGGWLIGYIVFNILAAIFLFFPLMDIVYLIVGILSIIARIIGFNQINKVFKTLSRPNYRMDSGIFPLYGWYGVLAVVALFISVFTFNPLVILIVAITVIVGEILLLFAIGYKLIGNSSRIQKRITEPPTTAEVLTPDQIRAQVKAFAADEKVQEEKQKFCSNCGANIETADTKCGNCGTNL